MNWTSIERKWHEMALRLQANIPSAPKTQADQAASPDPTAAAGSAGTDTTALDRRAMA